jgi:hypothetical protein
MPVGKWNFAELKDFQKSKAACGRPSETYGRRNPLPVIATAGYVAGYFIFTIHF